MNLEKLKTPFMPDDIEWRVQRSGMKNGQPWAMVLAYVTNRAIMDRLDEVVGPGNWKNEYSTGPDGGVLCGLSIKIDGEWITKFDGADNTQVEAVKGGLSGAMKRAAVHWGIGRYLYKLDATFAVIKESGRYKDKAKNKQTGQDTWFKWDPPLLPDWAIPSINTDSVRKTFVDEPNVIEKIIKLTEDNKDLAGQAAIEFNTVANLSKMKHAELEKVYERLQAHIEAAKDAQNVENELF